MPAPLLTTKLHIPRPHHDLVSRPLLIESLKAGLSGKLTLVAAPAGFGKTTLLSSWIQYSPQAFAWVSLHEGDNDTSIFWVYVVSALQQAYANCDQKLLATFDPVQLPPIQTLLTNLINELDAIQQKIVLILDDYHVISNSQIHKDLTYLIDNQPSSLHVIILTRADPPLPIARLRGRGQLTEIRSSDLKFSLTETGIFLNEIMQLDLAADEIAALDKRTEGWIIGLQLAAFSMRGREDKQKFISDFSGSHHFVIEYLTEEIINHLSKASKDFLLQSSVLDQFNAALCDWVFAIENSTAKIDDLLCHNLFVIPLDDEHCWFRYHHLFRDLLKNHLQREYSLGQIKELYQRASQWFAQNNSLNAAVGYALLAQDFAVAADLIERAASSTMLHGQLVTLLNWIEAIPETLLETHPRLRFYQAWALSLGGQPKEAEKIVQDTKSTLERLPDSPKNQALRGELAALLTGIITYYNNPARIIREGQEALTYLSEDNLVSRARVHVALGTAYAYDDQMDEATQTYQHARDLALKAKNPFLATAAIEMLAGMQIYHLGKLREAQQNLEQVLALGRTKKGVYQAFAGTAHIMLAAIYLEWNNLDTAESYLKRGIELLQQGGIGYSLTHTYCTKARLHVAKGQIADAVDSLERANQAAQDTPLMHILIHNMACQVKLALTLGDLEKASRWDEKASEDSGNLPKTLPAYLCEVQQNSVAWLSFARGNLDKTFETLDRVLHQAECAGRKVHVIEACLLKALTYQKQGDTSKAIEALKHAISFAAAEGFTRIFLEGGKPVWEMLGLISRQDFNPQFVNKLLAAFDVSATKPELLIRSAFQSPPENLLIEPLTERECEVLKLIAVGYTNQQIADALVVTLNTVKKHTTHIYGKLGVKNRAQAIAKGREIRLIS